MTLLKSILVGALAGATYNTTASVVSIEFDVYESTVLDAPYITATFENIPDPGTFSTSPGSLIEVTVDAGNLPGTMVVDNLMFTATIPALFTVAGSSSVAEAPAISAVNHHTGAVKYTVTANNAQTLNSTGSYFSYIFAFEDDITPQMFVDSFNTLEEGVDAIAEVDIHDFNGYTPHLTDDTWLVSEGYSTSYNQLTHGSAPSVALIPEPTTTMLVAFTTLGLLTRRRR